MKSQEMAMPVYLMHKPLIHTIEQVSISILTSCARGDTICLRPCKLTVSSHLFARCHLFRQVGYLRHQQQV